MENTMGLKIQEASQAIQVPRSTIRYWETAFPNLIRPNRTNGGQRRYSQNDLSILHKIKHLLHEAQQTKPEDG